jgi:hypothetical protein
MDEKSIKSWIVSVPRQNSYTKFNFNKLPKHGIKIQSQAKIIGND